MHQNKCGETFLDVKIADKRSEAEIETGTPKTPPSLLPLVTCLASTKGVNL